MKLSKKVKPIDVITLLVTSGQFGLYNDDGSEMTPKEIVKDWGKNFYSEGIEYYGNQLVLTWIKKERSNQGAVRIPFNPQTGQLLNDFEISAGF